MYVATPTLAGPTAPEGGTAPAPTQQLTAVDWFQIATPVAGGLLGFSAFIATASGHAKTGNLLLAGWALLTSISGAAIAYQSALARRAGAPPPPTTA